MKKIVCLTVVLVLFLSSHALAMGSVAKIPSPRAGLVILINRNIGLYANCFLFEGRWSYRKLITVDRKTGDPVFTTSPVAEFGISPAHNNFYSIRVLELKPEATYTVFIIWTRINGAVIDIDTVNIKTSSDPFGGPYTDPYGRKIWADEIIKLPKVNARGMKRLRLRYEVDFNDLLRR